MSRETSFIPGGMLPEGEGNSMNSLHAPHKRKWGHQLAFVLSVFLGALMTVLAIMGFRRYQVGWELIIPVLIPLAVGSTVLVYRFLRDR